MGLSLTQIGLWVITFLLECVACFLAFRHRLYTQLRFFFAYLATLVIREVLLLGVYFFLGYSSRFAFYAYWLSQVVVLLLRIGSVAEIIYKAWRDYPGFRVIASWLSATVAALLIGRACWIVFHDAKKIAVLVLGIEHQCELIIAVVLFVLCVLWIRYDVPLSGSEKLIALGFLSYSLVQEVNDAIAQHWVSAYFHWRDRIEVLSFIIVLVTWITALRKSVAPSTNEPSPAPPTGIDEYMQHGTALLETLYRNLRKFRRRKNK